VGKTDFWSRKKTLSREFSPRLGGPSNELPGHLREKKNSKVQASLGAKEQQQREECSGRGTNKGLSNGQKKGGQEKYQQHAKLAHLRKRAARGEGQGT